MSVSFSCKCLERSKPVSERRWFVLHRYHNHSAFNGYHRTPSDYSSVSCRGCNAVGRTKAKYVAHLKDSTSLEEHNRRNK